MHRLLALYLPQYHPTHDNDTFWGPGFTEWRNVAAARPLFWGHYQPHLPADLGFYDLRLEASRAAQATLARRFGIYGFCYYHYWFDGHRPFGELFDTILRSGHPDLPFCLCWANETWTRQWGGSRGEVLLPQTYSQADDTRHMRWLMEVFANERYIKVEGRPLLLVYRAGQLPAAAHTLALWRRMAQAGGFPDLYLCRVEHTGQDLPPHTAQGFDAAMHFQPDWGQLRPSRLWRWRRPGASVYSYAHFAARMQQQAAYDGPRFPTVSLGYDNSPRRRSVGSTILHGATAAAYQRWLTETLRRQPHSPEENFVFINAWNEWAEGCHLEPDTRHGDAFLQATAQALRGAAA